MMHSCLSLVSHYVPTNSNSFLAKPCLFINKITFHLFSAIFVVLSRLLSMSKWLRPNLSTSLWLVYCCLCVKRKLLITWNVIICFTDCGKGRQPLVFRLQFSSPNKPQKKKNNLFTYATQELWNLRNGHKLYINLKEMKQRLITFH